MSATTPSAVSSQVRHRYRAFISYSHAADGRLAPAIQSGLQRFSKPWYRLRAMRVFRDQTGFAVTPELWGAIEASLRDSEFFLLLASPKSAQSKWVEQEVDWWLDNRSAAKLLIVLTDGELVWEEGSPDFDWDKTNALPRRLERVFSGEPLHLDLRWARTESDLSLRRPKFAEAIACLAAALCGKSLDELIGEDIRQHEKTMRLVRFAGAALLALTLFALFSAFVALQAKNTAQRVARRQETNAQRVANEVRSRQIAAVALNQSDAELAVLLAVEAVRLQPTSEAVSALRQTLAAPLEPLLSLPGTPDSVNYAVFSPDGATMLRWGDAEFQLCDANSGQVIRSFSGPTNHVLHGSFSPDGRHACAVNADGGARIWDIRKEKAVEEFNHPDTGVGAALWSPDGNRLLTFAEYEVFLWEIATGNRIATLECSSNPVYFDRITGAAFHPNSSRMALNTRFDPVVFDTQTGSPLFTLEGHTRPVRSIAFSPDGNWLVTASEDGTVRKWRAAGGQCVGTWKHDTEVWEARFSPDGRWVASRDANQVILIWDVESGRVTTTLEMQPRPERPLVFEFSPTGDCVLLASLESRPAEIWETRSGTRLAVLGEKDGERRTLRFSPDGRRALVGSYGAPARIYPCEVCGTLEGLQDLARSRVSREMTEEERVKYLPPQVAR